MTIPPTSNAIISHIEFNYDPSDSTEWLKFLPRFQELAQQAINLTLNATSLKDYVKEVEVSILLSEDEVVKKLNNKYRGKNTPTNILSFPMNDIICEDYSQFSIHEEEPLVLGDMVFARETLMKEAKEEHIKYEDHFIHLVIHGTLHLLGYDHEVEEEAEKMEALEIALLEKLHIKNPYQFSHHKGC